MTGSSLADPDLETPGCDLCGSSEHRLVLGSCRDRLCRLPGVFDVVECRACRHWYLRPRPTPAAIGRYYAAGYYTHRASGLIGQGRLSRLQSVLKRAIKAPLAWRQGPAVEDLPPRGSGTLLDVGCGNGEFMARMRRQGWDVTGFDVDPAAVAAAKALLPDAAVYCGTIEDPNLRPSRYALIMVSHVLEHMYSPRRFLETARTLLEPGGMLVIRVPMAQSVEARIFGRRWRGLEAPRHLHHFRPATLSMAVERAGLRVRKIRREVLPMSMSQSLVFCLEDLTGSEIDGWGIVAKLLYAACYVPAMLLGALGAASSMELIAEPSGAPASAAGR